MPHVATTPPSGCLYIHTRTVFHGTVHGADGEKLVKVMYRGRDYVPLFFIGNLLQTATGNATEDRKAVQLAGDVIAAMADDLEALKDRLWKAEHQLDDTVAADNEP